MLFPGIAFLTRKLWCASPPRQAPGPLPGRCVCGTSGSSRKGRLVIGAARSRMRRFCGRSMRTSTTCATSIAAGSRSFSTTPSKESPAGTRQARRGTQSRPFTGHGTGQRVRAKNQRGCREARVRLRAMWGELRVHIVFELRTTRLWCALAAYSRAKSRHAFTPPNPNEFFSAATSPALRRAGRASFEGWARRVPSTRARASPGACSGEPVTIRSAAGMSADRSTRFAVGGTTEWCSASTACGARLRLLRARRRARPGRARTGVDGLDCARRAEKVPDRALGRGDEGLRRAVEERGDRGGLGRVADGRRRRVAVHVPDLRPPQRSGLRPPRAPRASRREGATCPGASPPMASAVRITRSAPAPSSSGACARPASGGSARRRAPGNGGGGAARKPSRGWRLRPSPTRGSQRRPARRGAAPRRAPRGRARPRPHPLRSRSVARRTAATTARCGPARQQPTSAAFLPLFCPSGSEHRRLAVGKRGGEGLGIAYGSSLNSVASDFARPKPATARGSITDSVPPARAMSACTSSQLPPGWKRHAQAGGRAGGSAGALLPQRDQPCGVDDAVVPRCTRRDLRAKGRSAPARRRAPREVALARGRHQRVVWPPRAEPDGNVCACHIDENLPQASRP